MSLMIHVKLPGDGIGIEVVSAAPQRDAGQC